MSGPEDLYGDDVGPDAYSIYEVYVDAGEAEKKFNAFTDTLGDAIEISWKDREWK